MNKDKKLFRIEEKMVYDELQYDLIWQADGKNEEVAFLIEKNDLEELAETIKKALK